MKHEVAFMRRQTVSYLWQMSASSVTSASNSRWSKLVNRPQSTQPASDSSHGLSPNRPRLTRKWSRDTVQGSWESSFRRSLSGSLTRDQESARMESVRESAPRNDDTLVSFIEDWLMRQGNDDTSTAIESVSDLDSARDHSSIIPSSISSVSTSSEIKLSGKQPVASAKSSRPSSRLLKWRSDNDLAPDGAETRTIADDVRGVGDLAEGEWPRYAANPLR